MTLSQIAIVDLLMLTMGFGAGVVFSVSVLFADILILRRKAQQNVKAFDKVIAKGHRIATELEAQQKALKSSLEK